jgi:hypothetical protein
MQRKHLLGVSPLQIKGKNTIVGVSLLQIKGKNTIYKYSNQLNKGQAYMLV